MSRPSWRNYRDNRLPVTSDWRVTGYPRMFSIDHRGVIRMAVSGAPNTEEADKINARIDQLLEELKQGGCRSAAPIANLTFSSAWSRIAPITSAPRQLPAPEYPGSSA